jgi:DNA-binding response OmpR family regulator
MAKILLIDDDTQILSVMTSFLKREQHEISTAANGKQGIRHLESGQFDLVITDVLMPEQDGLEVLMWLKKQRHRARVIAISGGSMANEQNELLHMCKLLSADKVLPKPVDFETLTSAVREVLKGVVESASYSCPV